jgi:hypothetical protein
MVFDVGRLPKVMQVSLKRENSFVEEVLTVPVIDEVDVLVCGGGPSGVAAAIAAARQNASVILLERHGFLGGEMTAGLVVSPADTDNKGGIVDEFFGNLRKRNALERNSVFDPEQAKIVLDDMVIESGAKVLFHAYASRPILECGQISGVTAETKQGRIAIRSRIVIDCTGDGDISAAASVPFIMGRKTDGRVQATTMMFRIGGSTFERDYRTQIGDMIRAAIKNDVEHDAVYDNPAYFRIPNTDDGVFGWSHVRKKNPLNAFELSEIEVESRRQIDDIMEFIKEHLAGFQDAYLVQTAVKTGIRESRHILGEYVLTKDDVKTGRQFDDAIVQCSFPIDIHSDEHIQTNVCRLLQHPT